MKQKMFGTSNLSQEEYMSFYNQTGIDIDNRQEMIIELLKYMEDSIYKLVHFAKGIPGFADCHLDDQVLLVKGKLCTAAHTFLVSNLIFSPIR